MTATSSTVPRLTRLVSIPAPVRKPPLPALTGLRTLLALNIVLFHFTPPHLHYLYPVIDNAYVFVGFFFLISGFVLTYNYGDRALTLSRRKFYLARAARIYPVYLLALLISLPMLADEWQARSHSAFLTGLVLTPIGLQGWLPPLATFWNTVGWTVSAEFALYLAFPFVLRWAASLPAWNWPIHKLALLLCAVWLIGMVPHTIYLFTNPDHLTPPVNRFSYGFFLRALKFAPPSYTFTFFAGVVLARIQERTEAYLHLPPLRRMSLAVVALVGLWAFFQYAIPVGTPYVLIHACLLMPLFALLILGLCGSNPLAAILSIRPLVRLGETTFALYLLHFNVFILIHRYHWPEHFHVTAVDPWISYLFLLALSYAVMRWIEKPARKAILTRFTPAIDPIASLPPRTPVKPPAHVSHSFTAK